MIMIIYDNLYFYIATLYELIVLCIALQITIIPIFRRVTSAATITAHHTWAMCLFLGDVHLSELERLDKPCATVGHMDGYS